MSKDTSIQWADSTLNLEMGCDGCELWKNGVRKCYAGQMIDGERGFAGRKGYPINFATPKLFLERLPEALRWGDLTGKERDHKPWMGTMPRIIFLNDMGDTFTKSLPLNWLAPLLPSMAEVPHQFLILTKRPSRMVEFSQRFPFPDNFWLGTSITDEKTIGRAAQLREVKGGRMKFLSVEPMWAQLPPSLYEGMSWVIFGGESGQDARGTLLDDIMDGINQTRTLGIPAFVKQIGARPHFIANAPGATVIPFNIRDSHGGDWEEWPGPMRIREMPSIPVRPSNFQADLF